MKPVSAAPDASPLIVLSKMESLDLLVKLYKRVIVSPSVWKEAVSEGKAMGARDAAYLEKIARKYRFSVARLTATEKDLVQLLRDEAGIGMGEAEVLAIAKSRKTVAVLDEKGGRAVAVGLGIAYVGTAGLLFEAFLRRLLSYEDLVGLLERLGKVAWVSPELLAGILRRAKEVEKR